MKFILFLCFTALFSLSSAQKSNSLHTSNLNLSKSNVNRIVYDSNESSLNVRGINELLVQLEKINFQSEGDLKSWLRQNINRFGMNAEDIKSIQVFSFREFGDCTGCKKVCKGRCVQDPGSECVCYYRSEPNLRESNPAGGMLRNYVFLSAKSLSEEDCMDNVLRAIVGAKRTNLNSSKSN